MTKRVARIASRRFQAPLLLAFAVLAGAVLRFYRLGARELSIDESLSWAAASAPSMADLLRLQSRIDSGKLALHEIALRGWIHLFGDSEAALRGLSALIGTAAILLMFALAKEFAIADAVREDGASANGSSEATISTSTSMTAAIAATIFAVALCSVDISREARMYAMMLAAVLAQATFLMRARRLGRTHDYAGVTAFTALAVAINFTVPLMLAAEAMWLAYLYFADGGNARARHSTVRLGAAMLLAVMPLLFFLAGFRNGAVGVARGEYNWIRAPLRFEPLATFENALGTWPFVIFSVLGAIGAVRLWRASRETAVLAMLWLWIPPLMLLAGSLLFMPMLVTRYVISSFVPMFILVALGLASIPRRNYRMIAIIVVITVCVIRDSALMRPGDDRWRDAARAALLSDSPTAQIGACHDYYLVRYYARVFEPDGKRIARVCGDGADASRARVVIVSPTLPREQAAQIERAYPNLVARFKDVVVRGRAPCAAGYQSVNAGVVTGNASGACGARLATGAAGSRAVR